jgi:hypothetical protein
MSIGSEDMAEEIMPYLGMLMPMDMSCITRSGKD